MWIVYPIAERNKYLTLLNCLKVAIYMTTNITKLEDTNQMLNSALNGKSGIVCSIGLIEKAYKKACEAKTEDAIFPLVDEDASIYHYANRAAYGNVLSMMAAIPRNTNFDELSHPLPEIFKKITAGIKNIERLYSSSIEAAKYMWPVEEIAYSGFPILLNDAKAGLWHKTQAGAYNYALEMISISPNVAELLKEEVGSVTNLKPFTVVAFGSDNAQIVCHHVDAIDSMHAFTEVAKIDGNLEMVIALEGHQKEGKELTFPGNNLVDSNTVLSQPEVFELSNAAIKSQKRPKL